MNTVIVGATGMIGTEISTAMLQAGHGVIALARNPLVAAAILPAGVLCIEFNSIEFNSKNDDSWKMAIAEADVVINLAGEPIGDHRWNCAVKEQLLSSRVNTTRTIVDVIIEANQSDPKDRKLINASAVGYYGDCGNDVVTEEHGPGAGLLAELCVKWEAEAVRAISGGIQVAVMRLGLVLAKSGVLQKMLYPLPVHVSPFKLGLGGPMGNGKQWMPWVHIEDVVGLFLSVAASSEAAGAFNVTSPNPVTNADFARTIGCVLHRPAFLPLPAFALRAIVGEFADALLIGQRAIPAASEGIGYSFKHTDLEEALRLLI